MSGPYQYTHWAWTLHDLSDEKKERYLPDETYLQKLLLDDPRISYQIMSLEMCPDTHRLHYQGYIQLFNKTTMLSIKEAFGPYDWVHLSQAKKSSNFNIAYCSKNDESHVEGPWEQGESRFLKGWTEQNSGKRKRDEVPLYVRDYTTYPSTPRQVHWLFGPPGLGKTPRAIQLIKDILQTTDAKHIFEVPSIATKNGTRWIGDDYQHQPGVLIDEFHYDTYHPDMIKMLLDIYPHKMATRFGGMGNQVWDPSVIILCSNNTLPEMKHFLSHDWLRKRLTSVIDLTEVKPLEPIKTIEQLIVKIRE